MEQLQDYRCDGEEISLNDNWVTKDGRTIHPENMTFEHRKNTIAMVLRKEQKEMMEYGERILYSNSKYHEYGIAYIEQSNNDEYMLNLVMHKYHAIGLMIKLNKEVK